MVLTGATSNPRSPSAVRGSSLLYSPHVFRFGSGAKGGGVGSIQTVS